MRDNPASVRGPAGYGKPLGQHKAMNRRLGHLENASQRSGLVRLLSYYGALPGHPTLDIFGKG